MTASLIALTAAIVCYGVSALVFAGTGAAESGHGQKIGGRVWLAGTAAQGAGFLLALLARKALPLLVVQPALTLSLAVTAVLGHRLGRHLLSRWDVAAIAGTCAGVALLASAARAGEAAPPSRWLLMGCAVVLALVLRARPTVRDPIALAVLAGVAFSVVALLARPVAGSLGVCPLTPALVAAVVLLVGAALLGQLLIIRALSGPATMAPLATMFVVETVVPGLAGLALLHDGIRSGLAVPAAVGLALSVAGCVGLATAARR